MVGISWMEAVLQTTSIHRLSLAMPGVRPAIRLAASMPKGVAAFPRPRRLAETLAAMVSITPRSRAKSGKSRPRIRQLSGQSGPVHHFHDPHPQAQNPCHADSQLNCLSGYVQGRGGQSSGAAQGQGAEQGQGGHSCPDHRHCHDASRLSAVWERVCLDLGKDTLLNIPFFSENRQDTP